MKTTNHDKVPHHATGAWCMLDFSISLLQVSCFLDHSNPTLILFLSVPSQPYICSQQFALTGAFYIRVQCFILLLLMSQCAHRCLHLTSLNHLLGWRAGIHPIKALEFKILPCGVQQCCMALGVHWNQQEVMSSLVSCLCTA